MLSSNKNYVNQANCRTITTQWLQNASQARPRRNSGHDNCRRAATVGVANFHCHAAHAIHHAFISTPRIYAPCKYKHPFSLLISIMIPVPFIPFLQYYSWRMTLDVIYKFASPPPIFFVGLNIHVCRKVFHLVGITFNFNWELSPQS